MGNRNSMIGKISLILMYVILTSINVWGFRKIDQGHETNFYLRYLFKKIGIIPTQILTICIVSILAFTFPLTSFTEGVLFGAFLFNTIHDYYTLQEILRQQ